MWDILIDAIFDTLKIIPVLYLVYLLISYIGHNNNAKYTKILNGSKKIGPLIGAATGCIPQCGFSVIMSDMYSKKAITIGTLIAVFIATSDEAIPLMLTDSKFIVPLLIMIAIKFIVALFFGYVIDYFLNLSGKKQHISKLDQPAVGHCSCGHTLCGNVYHEKHADSCLHSDCNCAHTETKQKTVNNACCADNIFIEALKHTINIVIFLFIATLIVNAIVEFAGMESLGMLFTSNVFIQPFIAAVVGLIPNCAASVFLVEFYMAGGITFGAMLAGLTAGSGIGLLVLFSKNRKNMLANVLIMVTLYSIGVVIGLLFTYIPVSNLF